MKLIVSPSPPLHGSLTLPGDKSLSHRAVLFAAVAKGRSQIQNLQISGVTEKMLAAVRQLGVEWQLNGNSLKVDSLGLAAWQAPQAPIDCGSSATTLRLLAGALSAAGLPAVLDGSAGLRRRPMDRILIPLQKMGVAIEGQDHCAPLQIEARPSSQKLSAITYALPVASAQVKSCLLLAGLAADGPVTLHEPGPSRDHTERLFRQMGMHIEIARDVSASGRTIVMQPPTKPLLPLELGLPGDLSSAAFLLVAALLIPGSKVTIHNVGLNPGRTGLVEALVEMGADLHFENRGEQAGEPIGDITASYSTLMSTQVAGERVVRMIDEFPIFAVAAAFARGRSVVQDAGELRCKESDRIVGLYQELSALGCRISETPDGFVIDGPNNLQSASVHPHRDHRLAMALTVAALAGNVSVNIEDAQIIDESYPEFCSHLIRLGARLELVKEEA